MGNAGESCFRRHATFLQRCSFTATQVASSPAMPRREQPLPVGSDGLVSSGLRNVINAPALMTFGSTDPQFKVVIRAWISAKASTCSTRPRSPTLSGRQTQIQWWTWITIVTGTDLGQTTTGGTGGTTVGGVSGAPVLVVQPLITHGDLPFGPTLDVIPYVSATVHDPDDIIPTITEFLVTTTRVSSFPSPIVSGGQGGAAVPLRAQLPLPHYVCGR